MIRTRTNKGFTLAEVLVVVGIIAILASLGSVAVLSYMRGLHQLEMDGIAKEIFVAAQNHLTMADSQGLLEGKAPGTREGETNVYYYVVGLNGTYPTDTGDSALDLMLPTASVDETVRLEGSYVIRYDHAHARVLDVFFDWKTGRFSHIFADTPDKYSDLIKNYQGEDKSSARREAGIGWYGGDRVKSLETGEKIQEPTIRVINAERLWVEINNPNANSTDPLYPTIPSESSGLQLSLIVKGETSGKSRVIQLLMDTGLPYDTVVSCPNKKANNCAVFTVLLDDVTKPKDENSNGNHFSNLFQTDGLIPGENITVQAVAFNNKKLTNVAYSSSVKTNSLFGDLKTVTENSISTTTAVISNIRHLENLSNAISNINSSYQLKVAGPKITRAEQTADLDWADFVQTVREGSGEVCIQPLGYSAEPEECYYPVNLADDTTYDGGKHGILNLNVNHNGPSGVFGTLNDCTLNDVYVYNTVNDATLKDAALEIRGTGNGGTVGGLVGEMTRGSINRCAAAVYVRSTGDSAGGLVGKATNAEIITNSYSGGHTEQGSYREAQVGKGRYNVQAAKHAGGLAGELSDTNVENCYSTCSAYCTDTQDTDTKHYGIGGLVGSAAGGEIKNCYSTGLVGLARDDDIMGAFAGIIDNNVTLGSETGKKNYCYDIINPNVNTIGNSESTNPDPRVGYMDETVTTYNSFFPANANRAAKPYDRILEDRYPGTKANTYIYPIKDITNDITNDNGPAPHYGDWPAAETLVINEKQKQEG